MDGCFCLLPWLAEIRSLLALASWPSMAWAWRLVPCYMAPCYMACSPHATAPALRLA